MRVNWVLVLVLAMFLGACGSSEGDVESSTTDQVGETTQTDAATSTTVAPTTTTTEPPTTTTLAASGGNEECLVGDWELDSEAFMDSLAAAFAEEPGVEGVTVEFVGGSYVVSLSETGLFTGDRDDWAFQMSMPEGAFRVTIDGLDTGSWSAEGTDLTISDYESASVLTAQAVVDGELVDLPTGTVPMADSSAVAESSTYECSGDMLIVEAGDDFISEFSRVGG